MPPTIIALIGADGQLGTTWPSGSRGNRFERFIIRLLT